MQGIRPGLSLAFLLLAPCALTIAASAADKGDSREALGLAGQVHVVVEQQVSDVTAANPNGEAFSSTTTTFSRDGFVAEIEDCSAPQCERTHLDRNGSQVDMEQKDNGLTVKTTQYFRDSGGEITEKREVEKYKNSDAASIRTTIYRTNQYGAEEIELENGEPVSRTIRQQTSEPNTVEVIWYVQTGDANGKRGWVLESDQLVKTVKWQRGEKVESDSGGGKMIRVTDARGNRVEEIEDFPSEFHRETHVYDDRGREVERSEWKRDGDRINRRTYVYDDDQNGNWIKKTELFTSSAMDSTVIGETTTRRIEYY